MLPRFLLSRGGPPVLQLQRLLVAAPLRPPDMGIRSARILGGNSAIGRLSISPVTVRYVSSDAKDSKKSKKPRKKEDKDKGKKGLRAKKGEEKYRKERGEEEEGEEGEEEGAMREVNVEGKAVRDTVGGDRKAPVGRAAVIAAATGVSAPEVETPKKESAPVAAQEVVATKAEVPPAPTVAGPMAGPAAETTPEAPVPEDQAPPAAEGLEAIAADPSTPGEASTASSTAAELGPSSTFGEAIEITSNSPTEPALKHLQQEAMLGEEPLKRESKSSEPEESKVEQESSVVDDANPPTPASKVEQESAMRSQEAVGKTGVPEAQPYTGPLDFYKLIASTSLPYANPHHLGRHAVPPKGASPPPPSSPSSNPQPPQISEIHTSHSAPTPFPTTTTAPNPQPITFASTRLNVPMASSEKPSSSKAA